MGTIGKAEINGNGNSLHERNVIDPEVARCLNWNVLHQAASKGLEADCFRELLASNPELVDALDSQERSLLHLASANGHVEIVKALIETRPEMCLARDRDGANPLHVAAIRGKVKVLDVLFQANSLAARAKVDRGDRETILHLCVKYNKLDILTNLLKRFKNDEFVNAKDDAGNTMLHLAVMHQKIEIIKHVLNHKKIDVNARNASKQTAMDIQILLEEQETAPEEANRAIKDLLHNNHAKRNEDMMDPRWMAEKRNSLMIVAVLMATIAFQAGMIPPGGLWQDDNNGHRAGEAVMAHNYPTWYKHYLRSNTIAFVTSLSTILLLIGEFPVTGRRYVWSLVMLMCVTFTSMALTYAFSITVMTPKLERESLSHIVVVALIVWCCVILVVLLFLAIRFIGTIVRDRNARAKAAAAVRLQGSSPEEAQNHV